MAICTFVGLTALSFAHFGDPFLQESLVYHLGRTDHRHNYSIWWCVPPAPHSPIFIIHWPSTTYRPATSRDHRLPFYHQNDEHNDDDDDDHHHNQPLPSPQPILRYALYLQYENPAQSTLGLAALLPQASLVSVGRYPARGSVGCTLSPSLLSPSLPSPPRLWPPRLWPPPSPVRLCF